MLRASRAHLNMDINTIVKKTDWLSLSLFSLSLSLSLSLSMSVGQINVLWAQVNNKLILEFMN